ncbi:MAG: DNA adenine methylase [Candidatus Moranbacteria bacterium]|nr:DNA adenine methylase [Candidatus Moranbacteria bacterium]
MKFYSPLRYPGGKNKLARFIAKICVDNKVNGHYVEPYAGGASVALYLLLEGYVSEITVNDIDRSIFAFWHSVLNRTQSFCELIRKTEITVETWQKMKEIQKNKEKAKLLDLGFSVFFLNRTNVSGIINGGIIGGKDQKGKYKIDCRFNKDELIKRIKEIARHRKNIHLYQMDAVELIYKISKNKKTIFYFDPPYYLKGKSLYVNYYKHDDHKKVSEEIKNIKNAKWIVSYDDVSEIRKMYKGYNDLAFSYFYTARDARRGKEILFSSANLIVEKVIEPTKI